MTTHGRNRGFTLIEVVIAMTLLSILVVLLASSLRIAASSWEAGESKAVAMNKKAVVYQFFKRHLTTIKPVSPIIRPDGTMQQMGFMGVQNGLQFVAELPASALRKGLQHFEISADPRQPSRLIVSLLPYQLGAEGQIPETVVLLEHVKAYSFQYFNLKSEAGNVGWQDQWMNSDSLPQLIKVSITLEDDSLWPDMVFPVRINTQPPAYAPTR